MRDAIECLAELAPGVGVLFQLVGHLLSADSTDEQCIGGGDVIDLATLTTVVLTYITSNPLLTPAILTGSDPVSQN